ncbi:MAG TPA: hypothetical protein DDW68_05175 [Verrucomicrobiales bacterium]|nr:hypothetical protein [Verrucomicrobiales bacterium]HBE96544.1 hypothetical protein [Verrucomicrobiales bacterium]
MKPRYIFTLGGLTVALVSCGALKNFQQSMGGSTGFDPLAAPGALQKNSAVVVPTAPSYTSGQWVETSMPNATFFRNVPSGNATADKMLAVATPMKVISTSGTYVKVELDSGDVGFVPEIMVAERSAASVAPLVPPLGDGVAPVVAPEPEIPGLPLTSPPAPLPDVAPPPEVPGITPPQAVD